MGMKAEIAKTHPHILEWFDKASKHMKQEIVAACFNKCDHGKGGGEWVLDLEKPFFQESKQRCVCVCAPWEPIEL